MLLFYARTMDEEILTIDEIAIGHESAQGYFPVNLLTNRGIIEAQYYHAAMSKRAVIFAGGVTEDFDSPALGLYPSLCKTLPLLGVNCLRIGYRKPYDLLEATLDVLGGVTFLSHNGYTSIGLIGHSFSVSVVVQSAALSPYVSTAIVIAPQNTGMDVVSQLHENQSILFLHGLEDDILPPTDSVFAYQIAHDPKKIILYENARHTLNEVASEVLHTTEKWFLEKLS